VMMLVVPVVVMEVMPMMPVMPFLRFGRRVARIVLVHRQDVAERRHDCKSLCPSSFKISDKQHA
jgi:hypothetical protein